MCVLLNGRLAGVSGIVGGLVLAHPGELGWRFAFIGGLRASVPTASSAARWSFRGAATSTRA
jgi:hypothetical protein